MEKGGISGIILRCASLSLGRSSAALATAGWVRAHRVGALTGSISRRWIFISIVLCSVVVGSKSGLGLELATAAVKVSMIWALTSVVMEL